MTPKTLIDPKTVTPSFYKMFYHRVKCQHCGLVHSYSEVFAYVAVASGYTAIVPPLKSMGEVEYNLTVKVESQEMRSSPWCHMCWNPDLLKGLPKADAQRQRPIAPSWAGTGLNPNSKAAKDKPKKGPKTYTIDDLDID